MDNTISIAGGIVHAHTEHSLKDSALSVARLCETALILGAPAVTLTDHGTLTGVEEFRIAVADINKSIELCRQHDCSKCRYNNGSEACCAVQTYVSRNISFKGIPGVEAYYEEDDNLTRRAHLLLLPKDYIGYKAISKAVTASNSRLDEQDIPRTNIEILTKYFGEGSEGHGHVIATSACMNGIIASILLSNDDLENNIAKLRKKQSKLYNPHSPQYIKQHEQQRALEAELELLTEDIQSLTAIANKPYTKKEKAVNTLIGTYEYAERRTALDREKAESEQAKLELEKKKKEKQSKQAQLRSIKAQCKKEEAGHERWYALENRIVELQQACDSEESLYQKARNQAITFENLFGKGNFYAEIQYHRLPAEQAVMPIVVQIADELGLPLIAANDAHMASNSDDEVKARQIMRSLRFNKWEPTEPSDRELYIKSDAELRSILSEILPEETVERAINGIRDVVGACDVVFEDSSHYPRYISEIEGETSDECLRRKCYANIEWRFPHRAGWTEEYQQRLDYEISVISSMGFSDYHLIVQDFLHYGRLLGKLDMNNPPQEYLDNPYDIDTLEKLTEGSVGIGIGPGRGSAVGSLACYLLGITGIDPIKYGLIFERFLNVERVSLPDIDSDFRPDIRNKVLDYVKHKYGSDAVCCIMTCGRQKAKSAIRNCARLLGSQLHDDTTTYLSLGDEITKAIHSDQLSDCIPTLTEKYSQNEHAMTIIRNAQLVEGVFTNVGMHAAGVIISDNGDVSEYVPLMYIPGKGQFAAQCDLNYCEGKGLLKMDFLGLNNLAIINDTIHLIQERYGIDIDIEKVPFESEVFKRVFATGNTNSVFQFESAGMKQMLRQFRPESIDDVILMVAAYRPGPMQYLDSIIAVKQGQERPKYIIPAMKDVLGNTYGSPIYQEQIMTIFNKFAGFSLGESDIIRRYMSKKKTDKFMAYKDKFIAGMVQNGAVAEQAEGFWEQLVEFSKYAFNRSHAAAYAFVAYYTAWLKHHYPKEYLCSVMNNTDFDKLNGLIGDCRAFGIEIAAPDINVSNNNFSVQGDRILYGLGNVKNVGNAAQALIEERKRNGIFTSFNDYMLRTRARKDVTESLIKSGGFDSFSASRNGLMSAMEDCDAVIKKIKDKEKLLAKYQDDDGRKDKASAALKLQHEIMRDIAVEDLEEDTLNRLLVEKSLIGAFISAHPLDAYKTPQELGCKPINLLSTSHSVSVAGIITELRITHRKADGKPLAFFTLEDRTGAIEVCCFTKNFKRCEQYIHDDAVVKIVGKCIEDTETSIKDLNDEGVEERVLKIVADSITPIVQDKSPIIVFVNSVMEWTDNVSQRIRPYLDRDGHPLVIYDKLFGQYRKTDLFVNKTILSNSTYETSI